MYVKQAILLIYLYLHRARHVMSYVRVDEDTFKFVGKPVEARSSSISICSGILEANPVAALNIVAQSTFSLDTI